MNTSQHIPVVSVNGERIVDSPVAAPLILKKKQRMVKGSEFNKAEVYVSIKTPFWYNVGEV